MSLSTQRTNSTSALDLMALHNAYMQESCEGLYKNETIANRYETERKAHSGMAASVVGNEA
jgi:hypothetical protein